MGANRYPDRGRGYAVREPFAVAEHPTRDEAHPSEGTSGALEKKA